MSDNLERRFLTTELRIEGEGISKKIVGYAAKFDSWSENLGGFREKIAPGAFKKTIKKADVRALFNHDPNYVLGRTTSGTLKLKEDENGLRMEVDPPNTQFARDLMVSIERGDITQQSFAFRTVQDDWTYPKGSGDAERTLIEVELHDVSPVTYPAYPDTQVGLRSLDNWKKEHETPPEQSLGEDSQDRKLMHLSSEAQEYLKAKQGE